MCSLFETPNFPRLVRAGLFKMRTSPSSFQGLREDGIKIIKELKETQQFDFVSEVSDPRQIEALSEVTSVFQVGARNMYNYELLKELSLTGKPVLLKRAFSATIKEWISSANYLSNLGESNILLCERGIRTFEDQMRNTLDLGAVIYLKENTNFKVIVDPSHALGSAKYVHKASLAAMAAGADGILVETHPEPTKALSDAEQAIDLHQYQALVKDLSSMASIFNREIIL